MYPPIQIVLVHLDIIKDFLLLIRLIVSLGGIAIIFETYNICNLCVLSTSLVVPGPKMVCVSKSNLIEQTSSEHFATVYVKLVVEV